MALFSPLPIPIQHLKFMRMPPLLRGNDFKMLSLYKKNNIEAQDERVDKPLYPDEICVG